MEGKNLDLDLEFLTSLAKVKAKGFEESILSVLKLFNSLDEIKNLTEEELVHPTSNYINSKEFLSPVNIPQAELLENVPNKLGPYIVSPLVVDDDS